jgi:hypothetical protein
MDPSPFNYLTPFLIVVPFALASIAWYVGVLVLLYKIWKKVKHLPG